MTGLHLHSSFMHQILLPFICAAKKKLATARWDEEKTFGGK